MISHSKLGREDWIGTPEKFIYKGFGVMDGLAFEVLVVGDLREAFIVIINQK
jgi:hypothetical protein